MKNSERDKGRDMKKGSIAIDEEKCKGCGFCLTACPRGVIVFGSRFNSSGYIPAVVADMDKCTGCTLCAEMCPDIAIEVWRERQ